MANDQVTPVELPNFDAKPLMNEQFKKWVEQCRAELEKERSIGELAPRVARNARPPAPCYVCRPRNAYDDGDTIVVDVVRHPEVSNHERTFAKSTCSDVAADSSWRPKLFDDVFCVGREQE